MQDFVKLNIIKGVKDVVKKKFSFSKWKGDKFYEILSNLV